MPMHLFKNIELPFEPSLPILIFKILFYCYWWPYPWLSTLLSALLLYASFSSNSILQHSLSWHPFWAFSSISWFWCCLSFGLIKFYHVHVSCNHGHCRNNCIVASLSHQTEMWSSPPQLPVLLSALSLSVRFLVIHWQSLAFTCSLTPVFASSRVTMGSIFLATAWMPWAPTNWSGHTINLFVDQILVGHMAYYNSWECRLVFYTFGD